MEIQTLLQSRAWDEDTNDIWTIHGAQQGLVVKGHMRHSLVQQLHLLFSNGFGSQVTLGSISSFSGLFLEIG